MLCAQLRFKRFYDLSEEEKLRTTRGQTTPSKKLQHNTAVQKAAHSKTLHLGRAVGAEPKEVPKGRRAFFPV